jgi:hypothetical protein
VGVVPDDTQGSRDYLKAAALHPRRRDVFWLTLFTLAVRESAPDRSYDERLDLPG